MRAGGRWAAPEAATAPALGWRSAWPGLCATLTGVGLGRFAYTALIPFLIAAGTATAAEAAYAGAGNLAGYLAGALIAPAAGRRLGPATAIRIALGGSIASLAACAAPLGFVWLLAWRFVIGVTGALLLTLAPSLVVGLAAPAQRGRAGGLVYTGIGLGTLLASASVAPLAAAAGPAAAWAALAALAIVAAALSWRRWGILGRKLRDAEISPPPHATEDAAAVPPPERSDGGGFGLPLAALLTIAANGMDGAGFVPHTIFWVDYIARVLDRGAGAGAFNWALFGAGALAGPFLAGALGDRIGLARTVTLAFACKAATVLLPVLTDAPAALALSSAVVGALSPGITSLVGARLTELVAPARLAQAWSFATLSLALFQAASAYGMSFALAHTGAYLPLYVAGAVFEAIGLLLCLCAISAGRRSLRDSAKSLFQ